MRWVNDDGEEITNLDFFCVKYNYGKEDSDYCIKLYYSTKQLEKMGITHMSYDVWELVVGTLSQRDNISLSWDRAENESYLIQHGFERLD